MSTQFKVQRCVADYRALLEDSTIEAIAICVPPQLHVEIALAAVDAGKHVFIEKPLALTLEDCDRLIERTAGLPLTLMLGFNTRWRAGIDWHDRPEPYSNRASSAHLKLFEVC